MTDDPSRSFWLSRIEQQVEYIVKFNMQERTRPDKEEVLESAINILEMCQDEYWKCLHQNI